MFISVIVRGLSFQILTEIDLGFARQACPSSTIKDLEVWTNIVLSYK